MPSKPTGPVPTKEARREHQDGKVVTVPAPPPVRPTREQVDKAKGGDIKVRVTADTSDLESGLAAVIPKLAAGEKTTEFWLTVGQAALLAVLVTVLACFDKITGTAALAAITADLSVTVPGYALSRGLAKR